MGSSAAVDMKSRMAGKRVGLWEGWLFRQFGQVRVRLFQSVVIGQKPLEPVCLVLGKVQVGRSRVVADENLLAAAVTADGAHADKGVRHLSTLPILDCERTAGWAFWAFYRRGCLMAGFRLVGFRFLIGQHQ